MQNAEAFILLCLCTSVSTRWSRGVSDTGQPWLFSLAAAPTWSEGTSWTWRRPPDATRTCPAGSPKGSTAAALRCVVTVLQRANVDCFGHFHVTARDCFFNFTLAVEVSLRVSSWKRKLGREGSQQLDDVSDMVWKERRRCCNKSRLIKHKDARLQPSSREKVAPAWGSNR